MAVLKKGSKGKPVAQLQTALNKNGASPKLKVDETFGPVTEAAVKAFQKKNKLKVDGIAGEISQFSLQMAPRPKSLTIDKSEFVEAFNQSKARNKSFNSDVTRLEGSFKKLAGETAKLQQLIVQRTKLFMDRRVKANKEVSGVYTEWQKKIESLLSRYKASVDPDEIKKIRAEVDGLAEEFRKKFMDTQADETMDTMRQTQKDMDAYDKAVKNLQKFSTKL